MHGRQSEHPSTVVDMMKDYAEVGWHLRHKPNLCKIILHFSSSAQTGAISQHSTKGGIMIIRRCRAPDGVRRFCSVLVPPRTQPIARGKHDRLSTDRRIAMTRVVSICIMVTTAASCLIFRRAGLTELALGRMAVAIMGFVWVWSTFSPVSYCTRQIDTLSSSCVC